jgi:mannosyltransferase
MFAHGQIFQIAWMYRLGSRTFGDVLVQQYFDDSLAFALAAAVVLALAILFWHRGLRRPSRDTLQLIHIALAWIVIPSAVLIIYSAAFEPVYYPRYLYFTAPAAAIVLAWCITTIAPKPRAMVCVLVALGLAAAPNYVLVQRGPYAKEGMDYSQVADVISAHAADGDCLVLDNTITWLPGAIRALTAARPEVYERLNDPGRGISAVKARWLWDGELAIQRVANRLTRCRVIWTVSDRDTSRPDHERGDAVPPGARLSRAAAYQVPNKMGFHLVERWQFSFAQVTKSTR